MDADAHADTRQNFVISAAELAALERDRAAATPKRGTASSTATSVGASGLDRGGTRSSSAGSISARSDRAHSHETEAPLRQRFQAVPGQSGRTELQRQAASSAPAPERDSAEACAEATNGKEEPLISETQFSVLEEQLRCARTQASLALRKLRPFKQSGNKAS